MPLDFSPILREIFIMFQGVESNIYAVVLGSQAVADIAIAQRAEVRTLVSKQSQRRRKQRKVSDIH